MEARKLIELARFQLTDQQGSVQGLLIFFEGNNRIERTSEIYIRAYVKKNTVRQRAY